MSSGRQANFCMFFVWLLSFSATVSGGKLETQTCLSECDILARLCINHVMNWPLVRRGTYFPCGRMSSDRNMRILPWNAEGLQSIYWATAWHCNNDMQFNGCQAGRQSSHAAFMRIINVLNSLFFHTSESLEVGREIKVWGDEAQSVSGCQCSW